MKAGLLASTLSAFSITLRESGAGSSAAVVRELADVLGKHRKASVAQLEKIFAGVADRQGSNGGATASDVVEFIANLTAFLSPLVKKDLSGGLEELVVLLRRLGDTPLAALNSELVVSASGKRTRKGAAPVDQMVIDSYLKRLEAALGKDEAFMQLYRELQNDEGVTKQTAVAVADRFNGPVTLSASRTKALERVLSRHRKLIGFTEGSASIGGKAA